MSRTLWAGGAHRAGDGRWSRGEATAMMVVGGALLFFVVTFGVEQAPCTVATPCTPDRAGGVILGLVLATPFLAVLQFWLAAPAALVLSVGLVRYDQGNPALAVPTWVHVLTAAYALACIGLVVGADRHAAGDAALVDGSAVPPAPPGRLLPAAGPAVAALALTAGALAWAWQIELHQARAEAQQATAQTVFLTVGEHGTDDTVELAVPGSPNRLVMPVSSTSGYPVGSTVAVAVDDAGLVQLRAEPYDLSVWYAPVTVLILVGLGSGARYAARFREQRRFFGRARPTRWVYVRRAAGMVFVYPGPPAAVTLARYQFPVRDDRAPGPDGRPVAARLYGTLEPGRWCTVTVGGVTLSPTAPVQEATAQSAIRHRRTTDDRARSGASGRPPGWWWRGTARDRLRVWPLRGLVSYPGRTERILVPLVMVGTALATLHVSSAVFWRLHDTTCVDGGCSPVAMATVGWGIGAAPVVLMLAAYLLAGPGRIGQWVSVAAFGLLFGVLTMGGFGIRAGLFGGGGPPVLDLVPTGLIAAGLPAILGMHYAPPAAAWLRHHPTMGPWIRYRTGWQQLLPLALVLGIQLAVLAVLVPLVLVLA